MIGELELYARFTRLQPATLRHWIAMGWVRPADATPAFDEADVARVSLICDLTFEIHIEEEALPVVLSLLDQVYDLRRQLGAVLGALAEQPPEVRARVQAAIAGRGERSDDGR